VICQYVAQFPSTCCNKVLFHSQDNRATASTQQHKINAQKCRQQKQRQVISHTENN